MTHPLVLKPGLLRNMQARDSLNRERDTHTLLWDMFNCLRHLQCAQVCAG